MLKNQLYAFVLSSVITRGGTFIFNILMHIKEIILSHYLRFNFKSIEKIEIKMSCVSGKTYTKAVGT